MQNNNYNTILFEKKFEPCRRQRESVLEDIITKNNIPTNKRIDKVIEKRKRSDYDDYSDNDIEKSFKKIKEEDNNNYIKNKKDIILEKRARFESDIDKDVNKLQKKHKEENEDYIKEILEQEKKEQEEQRKMDEYIKRYHSLWYI